MLHAVQHKHCGREGFPNAEFLGTSAVSSVQDYSSAGLHKLQVLLESLHMHCSDVAAVESYFGDHVPVNGPSEA
jgi:hypothetical protein